MKISKLIQLWHSFRTSNRWLLISLLPGVSLVLTVTVVACVLLNALLPTAFILITGFVIENVRIASREGFNSNAAHALTLGLILLGSLFITQQIFGPIGSVASDALARRLYGSIAQRLMRATLHPTSVAHLEYPDYLDQVQRAYNSGLSGPRTALNALASRWATQLQGLAALLIVARFAWWLLPVLVVPMLYSGYKMQKVEQRLIDIRFGDIRHMRRSDYFRDLSLTPGAAKEVRIFGLADWVVTNFQNAWLTTMIKVWRERKALLGIYMLATFPVIIAQFIALGVLGYAVLQHVVGVGLLVIYGQAILASSNLVPSDTTRSSIEQGVSGLKPLYELEAAMKATPLNLAGTRVAQKEPVHEVRFEDVAFRYEGQENDVYSHLNLTIPIGKSLAIVGQNGVGKTTLIKLLARLYDPTAGRIVVDGVDLHEYEPRSWQRRIAAIFQDFSRYPISAQDNIGFGAIEQRENQERLEKAARAAGAYDLIKELPEGWNTILSRQYSGGTDLSGGQWQRIALARALFAAFSGAGILILDEPTAQFDVRAEAAFYNRFFELTRGLTTIVISHRFSTVRRADHIVVLERGEVIEEGTHDELVAAGRKYATMFKLQAAAFSKDQQLSRNSQESEVPHA